MTKTKIARRTFSLLEILVALGLLTMASGALGWKIHSLLEKRKFRIHVDQFQSHLQTVQRMALYMQADWQGVLHCDGKRWTFEAFCVDPMKCKIFSPIEIAAQEIVFNGKPCEGISFHFFSSGEMRPVGVLSIRNQQMEKTLDLLKILSKEEGNGAHQLGPLHPNET